MMPSGLTADQQVLRSLDLAYAVKAEGESLMTAQRDFFICACATVLWMTCSHLDKQLAKGAIVTVPRGLSSFNPGAKRIALLAICLVLVDLPMARIHYTWQIQNRITGPKTELIKSVGDTCKLAKLGEDHMQVCKDFCENVKLLSLRRREVMLAVRGSHHIGTKFAEHFDSARGEKQEMAKIDNFFKERSCQRVLDSVDKKNWFVDSFCYFFALFCIAVILITVMKVIEGAPVDQADINAKALKNFANFYGLETGDTATRIRMEESAVSKYIWASLSEADIPARGEPALGVAIPKETPAAPEAEKDGVRRRAAPQD
jgi:hypothetical protein